MRKPPNQRKRPRVGDIIELRIRGKGWAYLQYIHNHIDPPVFGPMIRVLPGIFQERPESIAKLAAGPERFFTFFPLGAACHRGYVKIIGHEAIPKRCRKWPLFKAYNENYDTGKKTWFLWDGTKSWKVGRLPKEYYDCSLQEIVSLPALTARIASNWKPRDEVPPDPPRS